MTAEMLTPCPPDTPQRGERRPKGRGVSFPGCVKTNPPARFARDPLVRGSKASIVRFTRLIERFAAGAVEAQLRGPRQHQGAAARVAVHALERQRLEHRLPAAGADGEAAD